MKFPTDTIVRKLYSEMVSPELANGLPLFTLSPYGETIEDIATNKRGGTVKRYGELMYPQNTYALNPDGTLKMGLNPFLTNEYFQQVQHRGVLRVPEITSTRIKDGRAGLLQLAEYLCSPKHGEIRPCDRALIFCAIRPQGHAITTCYEMDEYRQTRTAEGMLLCGGHAASYATIDMNNVEWLRSEISSQGLTLAPASITSVCHFTDGGCVTHTRGFGRVVQDHMKIRGVSAVLIREYAHTVEIQQDKEVSRRPDGSDHIETFVSPFFGSNVFCVVPGAFMDMQGPGGQVLPSRDVNTARIIEEAYLDEEVDRIARLPEDFTLDPSVGDRISNSIMRALMGGGTQQ